MIRAIPTLLAAISATVVVGDAAAQTPDSIAGEGLGNCVLEWGAPPDGDAPALRHTQDDVGAVTDFFSGRTLFTCGTATMLADSAVSYEARGEVFLVGNVEYRDTLRTLESTYLTYYERADVVVAEEDVRLVRTADRSTLEGPHVEFLRAVSGIDELTTATGRPHMTFYPEGDDPGPPFEIDADRAVFAGEDEARAYGDVVVFREDLNGEADSVRLRRGEETGEMWGSPWIEAEGVRLEGETINFRSRDGVLEEVHAVGEGRAIGESFEVQAMIIDIELADEQPERVWAHGPGLSRALSGAHNVYGDSLEFAMFEGAIDTLYSIGEAVAVQGEEPGGMDEILPASDSITGATLPSDSMAAAPPADSTDAGLPADSAAVVLLDSIPAALPDSAQAATGGPAAGSVRRPRLPVVGDATWVTGDTIIAIFERPVGSPNASATPVDSASVSLLPDTAGEIPTIGESVLVPVDSLVTISPDPPVADSTADPLMERLTAIGDARSLYSQVRDSTQTNRRSKNYMIGKRIVILFEDGQPAEVRGEEAIGVFLDPDDMGGAEVPTTTSPGSVRDSLLMPPDSTGVPPDSTAVPPDSTAVPPDSTVVFPDSTAAPPDTTRVARTFTNGIVRAPAAAVPVGPTPRPQQGRHSPALRERRTTRWRR